VALGHFERRCEVSQGTVKAFYSGAPHFVSTDVCLGEVMLVTLDESLGVMADPLSLTDDDQKQLV
jgi:hypothetical protein